MSVAIDRGSNFDLSHPRLTLYQLIDRISKELTTMVSDNGENRIKKVHFDIYFS